MFLRAEIDWHKNTAYKKTAECNHSAVFGFYDYLRYFSRASISSSRNVLRYWKKAPRSKLPMFILLSLFFQENYSTFSENNQAKIKILISCTFRLFSPGHFFIMETVMEVTQVVYADILFVINAYVTYALLRATSLVCRIRTPRLRTVLAALLGGLCSLVVLIREMPDFALVLSRLAFSAALVFACYFPFDKRNFFRFFGAFFLVNFVFAGLMFALWYFVRPGSMLFFAGIVYFDIDALTLIIFTAVCYGVLSIVNAVLKRKSPENCVFELEIEYLSKAYSCRALLDTGNSLYEPFSSLPVIVCEKNVFGDGFEIPAEKLRLIPCGSVSGESVLEAFRPDSVEIKSPSVSKKTNAIYIALTENRIRNSEFGALLHPDLFNDAKVT